MIYQPDFIELLEWEALSDEGIELTSNQIIEAARLSHSISDSTRQWQTYLHVLAFFGLNVWLEEVAPDLTIVDVDQFIQQPHDTKTVEAAYDVQVAGFKLCLIVTDDRAHPVVYMPKSVVDSTPSVPDFYVLMEVLEEEGQVQICGYLRRDRLVTQQRIYESVSNQMYAIPSDWFTLEPTLLLLELRFLEPQQAQAPLPVAANLLPQKSINVAHWFSDRLDEAAQALSWVLMPASAPVTALRSVGIEMEQNIHIPLEARGDYYDLDLENTALRLYASTWILPLPDATQGWTLLVVLSAQPNHQLPIGIRLAVQDETQLLVEQTLQANTPDTYLYAQVGGNWNEQFQVTIAVPGGHTIALPPFTFNLENAP